MMQIELGRETYSEILSNLLEQNSDCTLGWSLALRVVSLMVFDIIVAQNKVLDL